MHFMTTENDKYHGPAASHLTVYIEPQEGKLRLAAQDIENRDTPHGLTQGPLRGGYNGTFYDSKDALFNDDKWHCVEAHVPPEQPRPRAGSPRADGIVRGWFDGKLVVDRTDVILRSTDFPSMKFNQFLLAPYFGPGLLPHEQTLWIDELAVGTGRLEPRRPGAVARRQRDRCASPRPSPGTGRSTSGLKPAEVLASRSTDRSRSWSSSSTRPGRPAATRWRCPEDTLGLLKWESANPEISDAVLPEAVKRMLDRLGKAAAEHRMYLVVCNDAVETDGRAYNTVVPARPRRQGDRPLPQGQPAAGRAGAHAGPDVPGLPDARPGDGRHADLLRHGLPRGHAVPGARGGGRRLPSHARRRGHRRRRHQPGRVPHAGRRRTSSTSSSRCAGTAA